MPSEPSDFDKNRSNPCYSKRPSITACPLRLSGGGGAGGGNSSSLLESWGVVPGGAGSAMALPDFSISVNHISTRRGRLCQPHYYWHHRIFRPSYSPVHYGLRRSSNATVTFVASLDYFVVI